MQTPKERINKTELSSEIKEKAFSLGFGACGFAKVESIDENERVNLSNWLNNNYHADMEYLANNLEKRCNPALLVENTRTVISLAINYYPSKLQNTNNPQFAYYAYGQDYHDIVKQKLNTLLEYIKEIDPSTEGRIFCDTAPVLERYWAAKAGIGFIGKNTLLIIPKMGSFYFLGEIILNKELIYNTPLDISCGKCTRCLDACPTNALEKAYLLNSNKCISYQTIENKGEIDKGIKRLLSNRFYGCDICQLCCPWNRYSRPHSIEEFNPKDAFLSLTEESLLNLSVEDYQKIFKGSAIKRAKFSGLIRNIKALTENNDQI